MMITAPSIIIPKSIAPRLIRLAHTLNCFMSMKANNRESGIVVAVIIPPRTLPNNITRANITMRAPSKRFVFTVLVVLSIRELRSRNGFISKPSGKDFCTFFMRSCTFWMTELGFDPLSISTIPPTASCPSWVNAP